MLIAVYHTRPIIYVVISRWPITVIIEEEMNRACIMHSAVGCSTCIPMCSVRFFHDRYKMTANHFFNNDNLLSHFLQEEMEKMTPS